MKAPAKTKIFIVEDELVFQEMLVHYLHDKLGYQTEGFANGEECLSNLYKNPDVVLLDYNLVDKNGLEVLKGIKSINPDIHVLLVSGQNNIPIAVDVLKYGAFDYVVKNAQVFENIGEKILQMTRLSEALEASKRKRTSRIMTFCALAILGTSVGVFELFYS